MSVRTLSRGGRRQPRELFPIREEDRPDSDHCRLLWLVQETPHERVITLHRVDRPERQVKIGCQSREAGQGTDSLTDMSLLMSSSMR